MRRKFDNVDIDHFCDFESLKLLNKIKWQKEEIMYFKKWLE